jgi:hypothetical protein
MPAQEVEIAPWEQNYAPQFGRNPKTKAIEPWQPGHEEVAPWDLPYEAPPSVAADVAKSAGSGLVKGTVGIPGAAGDVIGLLKHLGDWFNQKQINWGLATPEQIEHFKANREQHAATPIGTEGLLDKSGIGDQLYKPQTGYGQAAENIASFLPGAALPGAVAGNVGRAAAGTARFGVIPGLLSEGAGQVADRVAPPDAAPWARAIGGLLGTVAGHRVMSPMLNTTEAAAQRAADVRMLRDEGVPVSMGNEADSKGARYWTEQLRPEQTTEAREAFTRAVTRRAGIDGLASTGPEGNVTRAYQEAGDRFDDLQRSQTLQMDPQLPNDLGAVYGEISRTPGLYDDATVNAVRGAIGRVLDVGQRNGGIVPGRDYQLLRSDLNNAAMDTADATRSRLLHGVVSALDDNMGRSIAAAGGNPNTWNQARDQWRRMLVLKDAATSAGAEGGVLTPAKVLRSAEKIYGDTSRMRGADPFSDLARAGANVLGEMPSSGTSERAHVNSIIDATSRAIGGFAGRAVGAHAGIEPVEGLLLGEPIGQVVAGPAIRGALRATTTTPFQRYWGNQTARHADDLWSVPGLLSAAPGLLSTTPGSGSGSGSGVR